MRKSPPTRLKTKADLEAAVAHLTSRDGLMKRAVLEAGSPPLRKRKRGFESLLKIIVEQQLSTASANAIWSRLQTGLDVIEPAVVQQADDTTLRSFGLSGPKIRYCRALSEAVLSGDLDLAGLARRPDEVAMEALQSVKGIGRWTAEIYLLFCLGRPNVWPAGDIAVQSALQSLAGYDVRPGPQEMDEAAENWRPLRGVAALVLWNYYRHINQRPIWE